MKVENFFFHIFPGAVRGSDFEGVESRSGDDANDFFLGVDDGKVSITGFIKFVKHKRAEKIAGTNEKHLFFRDHEIADGFLIKSHGGGDTRAIFFRKN